MDPYEPNHNMFAGPHLPLTLLAGAAIMFFASQLGGIKQGSENMNWQLKSADKAIKTLDEGSKTLDENIEKRKALVAQSEQLQKQFTDLMKELDEVARGGDKDAEMIIKGYGIKVNEPPAGAAAPAGAAVPASAPPAGQ